MQTQTGIDSIGALPAIALTRKIGVDVGMKKAQKLDIIQDAGRLRVLYPFLHSTSKYIHTCSSKSSNVFAGGT